MLKIIEKMLGLGVIPPGWKAGIFGFLVALVALLNDLGLPVPEWVTESWMTKAAAVGAILLALLMKKLRPAS